ncbi:hypothetical protein [Streptomyces luteireticuli]|uniref:hypothetical protein n=1 Tax=Streptomyces luteireticuli TaxID=173858 RepID=UPI003557DB6B
MSHPVFADDEFPVSVLPDYPEDFHEGDGYDWIESLPAGWTDVPLWGVDGWDLGAYPYSVVAHYNCPLGVIYGLATFTEGDVTVRAYGSREARDAETDELALSLWRYWKNGPDNLPAKNTAAADIPTRFRGPYRAA